MPSIAVETPPPPKLFPWLSVENVRSPAIKRFKPFVQLLRPTDAVPRSIMTLLMLQRHFVGRRPMLNRRQASALRKIAVRLWQLPLHPHPLGAIQLLTPQLWRKPQMPVGPQRTRARLPLRLAGNAPSTALRPSAQPKHRPLHRVAIAVPSRLRRQRLLPCAVRPVILQLWPKLAGFVLSESHPPTTTPVPETYQRQNAAL